MFNAVLALFLKSGTDLHTSRHAGVISIFDREFIHTGELDVRLSKLLHKTGADRGVQEQGRRAVEVNNIIVNAIRGRR